MALPSRKMDEIMHRHSAGPQSNIRRILQYEFNDPTTQRVRMVRNGDYSFIDNLRCKERATLRGKINMLAGKTSLSEQLQNILIDIQQKQTKYDPSAVKEHSRANKLLKALNEAGIVEIAKVLLVNKKGPRIILTKVDKERLEKCIRERRIIFD